MTGPLFVVATMPVGGGPAAARQLVEAWGGIAALLPHAADLAEQMQDDPRPLLLVTESPCTMLSHVLAAQPDGDAAAALRHWSAAAAGWTRRLPVRAARWLAVDLDEARQAPQALLAALREAFALPDLPAAGLGVPDAGVPPLEQLLAAGAVARDRALQREAESLLALCTPLAAGSAAAPVEAGRLLAAALPPLRATRTAAAQVGGLEQRLQAAGVDLATNEAALRASRERLEAVEQENGLLIEQLLRAQDAWDQALAGTRRAEAALAEERAGRAAWQAEQGQQQALQVQRAETARLAAEEAAQRAAADLARELAARRVAERAAARSAAAARVGQQRLLCRVEFERLQVLAEDPTPSHRQLALQLQGLHIDGHARPPLELRLVEHHGRPGLAWFAGADGSTPFARWQPQGQEGGRAYMLLIPGDPRTWPAFEALAPSDWHALLQISAAVADQLVTGERAAWGRTAQAAAAAVLALPPALRYERAHAQGGASRGELQLDGVAFGPAVWAGLTLRWDGLAGAAPRLELHGGPGPDERPLPALPAAMADAPAQAFAAALAASLPRALADLPAAEAAGRLQELLAPPSRPAGGVVARLGRRLRGSR